MTRPAVALWMIDDRDAAPLVQAARTPLGAGWGDGRPAVELASEGQPPCIVACLRARADYGLDKYPALLPRGWPLATYGGLQEALDLLVYLHADEGAPKKELELALELVQRLALRAYRKLQTT